MSRQLFASDGLLARSVEDLALLLPIMAQPDPRDPRYTPAAFGSPSDGPLNIAVVSDAVEDPTGLERAARALEDAGHHLTEVDVPRFDELAELWRDLLASDSGPAALARLREHGSPGALQFLEGLLAIAAPLDGPGYARGLAERHAAAAEWSALFARHPVILGPVSTRAPWPVGHDLGGADAVRDQWWGFRLTVATSALGLPAISLPAGLDAHGRPLGVQLIAARWNEALLLDVAADLERRSAAVLARLT
jgi:amidase